MLPLTKLAGRRSSYLPTTWNTLPTLLLPTEPPSLCLLAPLLPPMAPAVSLTPFGPLLSFDTLTDLVCLPFGLSLSHICTSWDDKAGNPSAPPTLTLDDFPESAVGCIHAGSITRILEALEFGFQHPIHNPDSPIPCDLWLLLAANLIHCIWHSICRTSQSADHPTNVFDVLSSEETALVDSLGDNLTALTDYFSDREDDPDDWDQCMSCLDRFHVSLTEMNWRAIVGSASGDVHAAYTTHINDAVQKLVCDLDSWTADLQHSIQEALITSIMSDDSPSIPERDPRITAWLDHTCADMKVRARKVVPTDTSWEFFLPWAKECLHDAKGKALSHIDSETHKYECGLCLKMERQSRLAAEAYGRGILDGYQAEAEAKA